MPQNTNLVIPAATWTLLTDADVTSLTFQNKATSDLLIVGTVGAVAPTSFAAAITYGPSTGERNVALADLFPGVAATRVYAYSESGGQVFVSHA
jgi:hypothetical protein